MNIEGLKEHLIGRLESYEVLPWLDGYSSHGGYDPDGPPEGEISLREIGKWLSVIAVFRWSGSTMDQTTDRLSGDPYSGIVRFDWIGLSESAPAKASNSDELDKWAKLKLRYACEYTDVGIWGVQEGSWVDDLKEDGTVVIKDAEGRFEDVDPQSLATTRTIQLE